MQKCHFESGPKALDMSKNGIFGNFEIFVKSDGRFLGKMSFLDLKKAIFQRLVKGPLLDTLNRSENRTFWTKMVIFEGSRRNFEKVR